MRQALIESLIISFSGGVIGLVLGVISVRVFQNDINRLLPLYQNVRLNGVVLLVLFVVSIVSAIAVCVLPVWYSANVETSEIVRTVSFTNSVGTRQRQLRDIMVAGEIALTLVLLAAGGLMVRTLQALHEIRLGFNESNVLTASLIFQDGIYSDKNINTVVYEPLLQRIKQLPGVQSAAISTALPMRTEFSAHASFVISGDRRINAAASPHANLQIASFDLPMSLGVRVIHGRFFRESDSAGTQTVAVVNQSFAKHYLDGADPSNFTLRFGKKDRFASVAIIGVLDDMKEADLDREVEPEIYICASQVSPGTLFYPAASAAMQLAVRTNSNPENLTNSVRRILRVVAPDARAGEIETLHQVVEDLSGNQRFAVKLLELFGVTALLISLSGLYGSLQFSVNQARRDIAIRVALGAQRVHVVRHVLLQSGIVVGAGLSIGVCLSLILQMTIRSYLFGLQTHGLFIILVVTFMFAVCGALATYIPARRAASIDPVQALREE
jgi:predicted permease